MYQSWGVIGLGLSVFALSPFTPTQRFGCMTIALLTATLLANLLLLPAILAGPLGYLFSPRRQNKKARGGQEPPRHTPPPPKNGRPHQPSVAGRYAAGSQAVKKRRSAYCQLAYGTGSVMPRPSSLARSTITAARATSWIAIPTDLKIAIPPVRERPTARPATMSARSTAHSSQRPPFPGHRQNRPPLPGRQPCCRTRRYRPAHRVCVDFGATRHWSRRRSTTEPSASHRTVKDRRRAARGRDHNRQVLGRLLRPIDRHDFYR